MKQFRKIKMKGLYKMRQEMSREEGRYLTINECFDIIQKNLNPVMWNGKD